MLMFPCSHWRGFVIFKVRIIWLNIFTITIAIFKCRFGLWVDVLNCIGKEPFSGHPEFRIRPVYYGERAVA